MSHFSKSKLKYLNPWYILGMFLFAFVFVFYPFSWIILKIARSTSKDPKPEAIYEAIKHNRTTSL